MTARLLDRALERAGLFHLRSHRVQIIAGGDHGEQEDKNAHQKHTRTKAAVTAWLACVGGAVSPDPDGRKRQREPNKIEQQFHASTGNPNYTKKT